jgi:hypothetical protein
MRNHINILFPGVFLPVFPSNLEEIVDLRHHQQAWQEGGGLLKVLLEHEFCDNCVFSVAAMEYKLTVY